MARKPARWKIAEKSYRSNKETFSEELFPRLTVIPTPPEFAKNNKALKEAWYRVCDSLLQVDLLYESSLHLLERWLKFHHVFNLSFELVEKEGMVIPSLKGDPKLHPAINIMVKSNAQLMNLEKLLFVTPSHMVNLPVDASDTIAGDSDPFKLEQ